MVICPIALAVGCRKCPIFSICPVKTTLGDYKPPQATASKTPATKAKAKAKSRRRRSK